MKNIVALVDSGVKKENCLREEKITLDTNFSKHTANRSFHGTLCASVMQDVNAEIDIHSIAILDENESTNYIKLQETLEYLKDIDVKIINLSLTTTNHSSRKILETACNFLIEQGKIVVAAVDNVNGGGYPASLKKVIGVRGLRTLCQNEFWYNTECVIQCACDMSPLLVPVKDTFMPFAGTSKAAAIMSAKISKIIEEKGDIDHKIVEKILQKQATGEAWNTQSRYLDSKASPSFSYCKHESTRDDLNKLALALSEVTGHNLTIEQLKKQEDSLLRYGLSCDIGCKFLNMLEILFDFKINRPVQYYRLLNVGTVLDLIKEVKNEKLEKTV